MLQADESPLEPGYRWYHGVRTAKLAGLLAEQMQLDVDKDILELGGLLHDVGKAGYRGPDPHGIRGARLIRAEIAHLFPPDKLERVASIVANHYQRPNSKYWRGKEAPEFPAEVLLVQDADILDHLGANAIWLAFRYGAKERPTVAPGIFSFSQLCCQSPRARASTKIPRTLLYSMETRRTRRTNVPPKLGCLQLDFV